MKKLEHEEVYRKQHHEDMRIFSFIKFVFAT